MKIFETHAHFDDECYDEDREILIDEMIGENGIIESIVNVGASFKGCKDSVELAKKYDQIYAAIGLHPEDIESLDDEVIEWLTNQVKTNEKVVAIGEIGLDYHYDEPDRELQKEAFKRQLILASDLNKPIIIHSRDACKDTLDILRDTLDTSGEHVYKNGGIIHCYSYSKEAALDFLDLGFHIGVGGVVTFKNAKKLKEAVKVIPLDRLVLETDSPYMAPEPHRGSRNDSRNIQYVAEKIAELKEVSAQEIIDITNQNAKKLFWRN
ncbi:TatD family hydrolase [Lachnospira multipara]|jgi:TatD DNase family protein|uniref:TatD family hydrolase n=1 Tax=Lachnospira multipara TaxID=28051 RepID=UPI000417C654|nr:TatD family hydrolase [Lachnospira multipara]